MKKKISIEEIDRKKLLGLDIPFQSLRQTISFFVGGVIGLGLVLLLISVFSHNSYSGVVVFGAILGTLPILYATLPSQMTIELDPEGYAFWYHEVSGWLVFFGYRDRSKSSDGRECFKTMQKKFMRWTENEIEVYLLSKNGKQLLTVRGPDRVLKMLRTKLIRPEVQAR